MTKHARVDVHQHIIPPFWADALDQHGGDPSGWKTPVWSPDAAVAFMDSQEIEIGILSLTAPGVSGWAGNERREMARRINEYGAELVRERPRRFGMFATLPLPDILGALAELEYVTTNLNADGIVLLSSYDDHYLGDTLFAPLWHEITRRNLVVFVHPGKPNIPVLDGIPGPVVDYPFDTTRSALHLVKNGIIRLFPTLRVVLSHAGGFLPYASHRFAELLHGLEPDGPKPDAIIAELQQFYFDTALSSGTAALPSLQSFAKADHVLYGSDFPYAPASVGASFTRQLDEYQHFTEQERHSIDNGAAKILFSRLTAP